jgi:hypothetical protein
MINKIIRNFVAKMVAGRSDDGIMITLKDPQKVEFQTAMMQDLLMRRGIDPNAIQSEAQLKMIINQIKAMEKAEDAAQSGIRNTESAKVFNIEGQSLDPNKPIIGGTQAGKELSKELSERLRGTNTQRIKQRISDREKVRNEMKKKYGFTDERLDEIENTPVDEEMADRLIAETDLPPPGSRGGADDIAAPVQSSEESLKNMMEAENKKAIDNLKQKMAKEKSRTQRISGNLRADNAQRVEIGRPKLDEDEYNYYREILGEDAEVDYYPVKGDETKELLEAMVKEQEDEVAYMKRLYDKGALDDPEKKADGGRIGFFLGSKLPKGLATLRTMLNYMGKKSDVVKKPSDVLKMVNPKSLNKMLEDPNLLFMKGSKKEGIMASDMVKNFQSKMGEDRVQVVRDMLDAAKNIKRSDDKILKYKNEIKERMMKDLNMSEAEADRAATAMSRLAMDITKMPDTPKLTDEGILQLENVLKNMETGGKKKRDLNADGGRIGLKEGSGMTRRTFLKLLGGAMSIPIIGKILKPLKIGKKITQVPIIKTDNVPGKPEWFDQLVNKVIIEGDEVTKRFATKDREIVHMKKLDEDTNVTVYQDLDEGAVRVEYDSPENVYGDPVQLQYKKPKPSEGDPRPSAEFDTAESGPVGRADGPDDYSIEIEELGGTSISDLTSDVSKLKAYATGEKPTLKEFIQSKKRKDRAKAISEGGENEMDEVIRRQGEFIENDLVDLDPPDLASGGIARMLGE